MTGNIDVAVYTDSIQQVYSFPVNNNRISGRLILKAKPTPLAIDLYIKLMDAFDENNSKELK